MGRVFMLTLALGPTEATQTCTCARRSQSPFIAINTRRTTRGEDGEGACIKRVSLEHRFE